MRLFFDGRRMTGRYTGMGRMVEAYLTFLPSVAPDWEVHALLTADGARKLGDAGPLRKWIVPFGVEDHLFGDPWREFVLPRMLREFRTTAFHDPAYFLPGAGSGARRIVTIHDLTPFRFPESNSRKFNTFMRLMTRLSLARADLILTDTEFIRQEIIERFRVREDRIVVAPLGVDEFPQYSGEGQELLREMGIGDVPYLFTNALMEPRKNLETLLKAAILLAEQSPNLEFKVVLGGERGWRTEAIEHLAEHPAVARKLVFTGYVDRLVQGQLYKKATAYVLPSLYEGFGLPALEALVNGCPLIAADIPPLREIAGDCAVFFPATEAEALAGHLSQVLAGKHPVSPESAVTHARRWSWERAVQRYTEIMRARIM